MHWEGERGRKRRGGVELIVCGMDKRRRK